MSLSGVIDNLQFARDGGELSGTLGLEGLPRLAEMPCKTSGVRYSLRGSLNRAGKPSLEVRASGRMELVCQRCLEPIASDLELKVDFELCADPVVIAQAEDDIDRLLVDREMDVARLVEDELLLALPQVPRHENCSIDGLIERPKTESPFSALAALNKRGNR